jgi:hypothetical protein
MGLAYTVFGVIAARRLFRASLPCFDVEWLELLAEAQRETGVTRPVELRVTRRAMSPAVWCFRRAQILLPTASLDWPYRQRRSVLLHELAHVARQDCWWQLAASVTCAVWWFHPLVWLAAARLRASGELAADDFVIAHGGGRVDYAQQLLTIARSLGSWRRLSVAQAMFHPSHLERRLRAILDPARPRAPLSRRASAASVGLAAALVVPLATLSPSAVRAVPPHVAKPVRVQMRFDLVVPPGPGQAPLLVPLEVNTAAYTDGIAVPVPSAPLTATTQLIPNWEMGQPATRLIPNYELGTAQVVLVEAPAASQVAPMAHAATQEAVSAYRLAYQEHTRLTE